MIALSHISAFINNPKYVNIYFNALCLYCNIHLYEAKKSKEIISLKKEKTNFCDNFSSQILKPIIEKFPKISENILRKTIAIGVKVMMVILQFYPKNLTLYLSCLNKFIFCFSLNDYENLEKTGINKIFDYYIFNAQKFLLKSVSIHEENDSYIEIYFNEKIQIVSELMKTPKFSKGIEILDYIMELVGAIKNSILLQTILSKFFYLIIDIIQIKLESSFSPAKYLKRLTEFQRVFKSKELFKQIIDCLANSILQRIVQKIHIKDEAELFFQIFKDTNEENFEDIANALTAMFTKVTLK